MSLDQNIESPISEPKTPENQLATGWGFQVNGEFTKAEAEFRQVLAYDPNSIEGYYGLGMALQSQKHKEEAVAAFQKALELLMTGETNDSSGRATMLRHLLKWQIQRQQPDQGENNP
jgi:Tfp pilus assembly protein PilF